MSGKNDKPLGGVARDCRGGQHLGFIASSSGCLESWFLVPRACYQEEGGYHHFLGARHGPGPLCAFSNPNTLKMRQLELKKLNALLKVMQAVTRGLNRTQVQNDPLRSPSVPCYRHV